MTTITIALPDERILRLHEIAARLGIGAEDLVRISIEDLLARPEPEFLRVADYVLQKNAELYQRLA